MTDAKSKIPQLLNFAQQKQMISAGIYHRTSKARAKRGRLLKTHFIQKIEQINIKTKTERFWLSTIARIFQDAVKCSFGQALEWSKSTIDFILYSV